MTDKNQEAFEQMQRLTKAAKNFYGSNYKPESLYPPRDTKFLLDEEYVPFDFDTDYDDPLYKKYRRVRMLDNPFEDSQLSGVKPPMQAQKSVQQTQPLISKQENNDYRNTLNNILKNTLRNYPIYKMGDAAGTLHAVKQNMDQHNLINGDNYYHRLGMCLNGQKDAETAVYSFVDGLAKEGYDFVIKNYKDIKTNNFSWENIKKHGKDSLKDLYNNYEATVYGLTNPDKDCRTWLKDLDINTNTWRNK